MPVKQFQLDNGLPIKIYKRRQNRHLRVLIDGDNNVKVSIPAWAPYEAGLRFAKSKQGWIEAKLSPKRVLQPGDQIGKHHRLTFRPTRAQRLSSSLSLNEVIVFLPANVSHQSDDAQRTAHKAATRALKSQAEKLLLGRLSGLAAEHSFEFKSAQIKSLKSRWGSCDQAGNITLSYYLMLLPWHLIDYVLLHELTHLDHHNHSADFWSQLRQLLPKTPELRSELRAYRATLKA